MFGLRFYLLQYIVFAASKGSSKPWLLVIAKRHQSFICWLIAVSKWASVGNFGTYTGFTQASKVLEYTGLS